MTHFNDWPALKAKNDLKSISAEVWNRKITFDKSLFPTSIIAGGEELLYAPIKLNARFGDKDGVWTDHQVIMHECNEEKAVYTVTQTAENLIVNAEITIEFDGFVKVDFSLIPFWAFHKDNIPRLTELNIEIPVKNQFSTLMHYWPNCESGVCLSATVLNSYATPEGKSILPFKPYVWTGWEYGGLGICCESDKNFELNDKEKCIEIDNRKEYTNVKISLLDHAPKDWANRADLWGNTIKPIFYSFVFQATPVKEFDKNHLYDWRAFHLYDVPTHPIFVEPKGNGDTMIERIAASGAKWLILHEDWTVVQNYGLPENEEEFKRFVRDCHNLGMKVMVYFGYEVSTLYPGFQSVAEKYLNKNVEGNFVGGWQRPPHQRDFTVCYNGDYSDIMVERAARAMDVYGVDGIYTDGTYIPWECANEEHGCGYRDSEGNLHYAYPIYAVREHVKKLYSAVHSRGGRLDSHQSSCCMMATLAFTDGYFDGENIQGLIAEDIRNLKLDTVRAEFMGLNMGIPCHFIAYTHGDNFKFRQLAGITLLHNSYPRANDINDLDVAAKIWNIMDSQDVKNKVWLPYWEQKDAQSDDNTHISCYKDNDSMFLVIISFNDGGSELNIKLREEYSSVCDLLDETPCSINGNELNVTLTDSILKLISLKK